jgi:hypothetical protein
MKILHTQYLSQTAHSKALASKVPLEGVGGGTPYVAIVGSLANPSRQISGGVSRLTTALPSGSP